MAPLKAKEAAKAERAAKADEKAALAAAGVTKEIKKQISGDTLLCTSCGATKLGPRVCQCKGGHAKPPGDYDTTPALVDAAKERHAMEKDAKAKAGAAKQGSVAAQRAKKKEARENCDLDDPDVLIQGDGDELLQVVEFEVGKLGMSLERNAISAIADAPSQAADLGVKVGWILKEVNGEEVGEKKESIMKAAAAAMKKGSVKFGFLVPRHENYHYCRGCKKFVAGDNYEESELEKGPGKQMCYDCSLFYG
mmetsp:Transcript_13522/g.16256  ORF Transcript_13522/g.16256 Transcript_13522/m.16256 type:complete len:251 (+) Transcript_13522:101-853(+)